MIEPQNNPHPCDSAKSIFLDYLIVLAKYSRLIIYTTAAVMVLRLHVLLIFPTNTPQTAHRLLPPSKI